MKQYQRVLNILLGDNEEKFTMEDAKRIGKQLGIDWTKFSVGEFLSGLNAELEHGTANPETNITNDDPLITGKLARAHLEEISDYYTRLDKMEKEAEKDEED